MIMWVDGNEFAILRSTDLEKWNISQRFELTDGFECPDLICLTDETGEHWFVTTADGYYYPGVFDGYSFNWSGKRYCLYMNKVPYLCTDIFKYGWQSDFCTMAPFRF